MKLKPTQAVFFGFQTNGRIFIEQYDENHKDMARCYLSPEQFMAIQHWFFNNSDLIVVHSFINHYLPLARISVE